MKCRKHLLDLRTSTLGPLHGQPGRQTLGNRQFNLRDRRVVEQLDIDSIDPTQPVEGPLSGRDVHQREVAVEQLGRPLTPQYPSHRQHDPPVPGKQLDLAADLKSMTARKFVGQNDRLGIGQQREELLRGNLAGLRPLE